MHQFFKGEMRLPPMRTETAVTGERQALNVRSAALPHHGSKTCCLAADAKMPHGHDAVH